MSVNAAIAAPRIMLVAAGAVARTAELLRTLGLSRPFVVTDPIMISTGLIRRMLEPLEAAGITPAVFSDTVSDPTDTVIETGVRLWKQGMHDCLIGFGGGSPIDTAKAIAILAARDTPDRKMRDFKDPRRLTRLPRPSSPFPPPPAPAANARASPSSPTPNATRRCSSPVSGRCRSPRSSITNSLSQCHHARLPIPASTA